MKKMILLVMGVFLISAVTSQAATLPKKATFTITGFTTRTAMRFAVGDLNNDGLKDIIIVERGDVKSGDIKKGYIFLQKKNHTFAANIKDADYTLDLSTCPQPCGVAIGKFNGDELNDIVIHGGIKDGAFLFYFQEKEEPKYTSEPTATKASGNSGYEAYVCDLNNDKLDDILTDGDALFQYEKGKFKNGYFYGGMAYHGRAGVGDLNGDGYNDAAFSSKEALAQIFWHRTNYGAEKKRPTVKHPDVSLGEGTGSSDLALGDLNGDKKLDIVVSRGIKEGELPIFYQKKKGFTAKDKPDITIKGLSYPRYVEVADFNGDGLDDIATEENKRGGKVYIFYQKKDAVKFADNKEGADLVLDTRDMPGELQAVDINNDGLMDLLVLPYYAYPSLFRFYIFIAQRQANDPI